MAADSEQIFFFHFAYLQLESLKGCTKVIDEDGAQTRQFFFCDDRHTHHELIPSKLVICLGEVKATQQLGEVEKNSFEDWTLT